MAEAECSCAMKQLMTFLVCLAIFGLIVALILYFGVSVPAQAAGTVPANLGLGG